MKRQIVCCMLALVIPVESPLFYLVIVCLGGAAMPMYQIWLSLRWTTALIVRTHGREPFGVAAIHLWSSMVKNSQEWST